MQEQILHSTKKIINFITDTLPNASKFYIFRAKPIMLKDTLGTKRGFDISSFAIWFRSPYQGTEVGYQVRK
uniref:Uncharacterized protein n=1 Tax=candidate division WOR-3 bacterium TaxID=2052148 RepID=A0A7C4X7P8_UNCW3